MEHIMKLHDLGMTEELFEKVIGEKPSEFSIGRITQEHRER